MLLILKILQTGVKTDTAFLQNWPKENSDLYRLSVESIFPSIPFLFTYDAVSSVPAVFPQVSNITETKRIHPLQQQHWHHKLKQSIPCEPNQSSHFQDNSSAQYVTSSLSPLDSVCVRVEEGRAAKSMGLSLLWQYRTATVHNAFQGAGKIPAGKLRQPDPSLCLMCSPDQFITFPSSSLKTSRATSCEWTSGHLSFYVGMHHYVLVLLVWALFNNYFYKMQEY